MQIQPIVVGTAGHIDHGKSTLVQALTGVDPDRWKEEKERGMTIDLGFARLDLPDGRRIGLIDVPGHERLVRNMVAGASGIDLVMLVVAADDGVMPQTREHLSILELLGVERGMVVITKIDLVDADMRELVALDVEEAVEGTFLEGAPVFPYSAMTREGFDELQAGLLAQAEKVDPHTTEGIFRMPIQRVFSAKGFGTIVTGIPVAGQVSIGETLEVLPLGASGKVRGLQAYHQTVESAQAGHSTAINLADVDHHAVTRGMVVAQPGFFGAVRLIGARLRAVRHLPWPIKNRMPIRLHAGTAEALGEVILLDREVLEAGEEGMVQLRLETPIVCAPGDRFVLRLASPMLTLGGGVVLEESRYRLKRFKDFVLEGLGRREASLQSDVDLTESVLMNAPDGWMNLKDLSRALKQTEAQTQSYLDELLQAGRSEKVSGDHWMASETLDGLRHTVRRSVAGWFAKEPHRRTMDVRTLRADIKLEGPLLEMLLERLSESGELIRERGGFLVLPEHKPQLPTERAALAESVTQAYAEAKFQPPGLEDLPDPLRKDAAALHEVLDYLTDTQALAHISGDLYMDQAAMTQVREAVIANCERHGELQLSELRDGLGTTRKYLIPILEALDAEGLTQRKGGARVLRATS